MKMIAKEINITNFYNNADILYQNIEFFGNLNQLYDRLEKLKKDFPSNKIFARGI